MSPVAQKIVSVSVVRLCNLTHDLTGQDYASAAHVRQLIHRAAVGGIAGGANFIGDLLAGLPAVPRGAGPAVEQDAAVTQLHCDGGLQLGAPAAIASVNFVSDVESFHVWFVGGGGPPLR